MKLKYFAGLCALALCGGALTSCDDEHYDVEGNPANLVYVNIAQDFPEGMPKNTYCYGLYQTPVGAILNTEPAEVILYAQCTKVAPTDIEVTFAVKPDAKVEGYDPFPADGRITVGFPSGSDLSASLPEATVVIPKGQTISNQIVAKVNTDNVDWNKFTGDNYLLPIVISRVNGATASEVMCQAYVGVHVDHKDGMINPDGTANTGTPIAYEEGMTATYSCPAKDVMDKNLNASMFFDPQFQKNVMYEANHADKVNEEVIFNVDLGKVRKVRSMFMQFFWNWYTVKDAKVETSLDGVDWNEQGTISWDNNSYNRVIDFWAAFEMRYVRVTTHSYYGGTGEGTAINGIRFYE